MFEVGVAVELRREPFQGLGAAIDFEEEVEGYAVLAPGAERVRLYDLPDPLSAASFVEPGDELAARVAAGVAHERGVEAVEGDEVVESLATGDGKRLVAAPASGFEAAVEGDEVCAEGVEDVVERRWSATGSVGLEAADELSAVELGQPVTGRYGVVKEQVAEMLGGQHPVFVLRRLCDVA